VAVWATSLLFAVLPLDWRTIPSGLVLGLSFGCLRAWTGTVAAPLVAVLAYGAVTALPVLRGLSPTEDVTFAPRWIAASAAAAALALLAAGVSRVSRLSSRRSS
jgi:hypothetical protein